MPGSYSVGSLSTLVNAVLASAALLAVYERVDRMLPGGEKDQPGQSGQLER